MGRILISLVLSTLILSCPGQVTFERTYGSSSFGEQGNSISLTDDQGYIIAGSVSNGVYRDVWLARIGTNGDSLWSRSFSVDFDDYGNSVMQCQDGGFIIAGVCNKNDWDFFGDIYLLKTDALGSETWSKIISSGKDEGINSMLQTNDDGFILLGYIGTGGVDGDVYLLKTDENGDTLWTRKIGGAALEAGFDIQPTNDDGYIITGWTGSFGNGNSDVYLVKTDENGIVSWYKTYGGMDYDGGYGVKRTTDEGYIIVGYTRSFGDGTDDIYLVRTDSDGDTLWTKVIAYPGSNVGRSVCQTGDGGFVLTGYTQHNGRWEVILIKVDQNGDLQWERTFPGNDLYSYGYDLLLTPDNGLIICGESGTGLNSDLYLIKTNEEGQLTLEENGEPPDISSYPCPNPSNGWVYINLLKNDKNLNIYNLKGQCLYSEAIDPMQDPSPTGIDLSSFPSGIYLIQVDNDKTRRSYKIVIF